MKTARNVMVILGSGLYDLYESEIAKEINVRTEYGNAKVYKLKGGGKGGIFLILRHGNAHNIAPHMINYRANIMAAKKLGMDYILATSAVGSSNPKIKVGSYVVLDQFIDFTKARPSTFFSTEGNIQHTDVSHPYSELVRNALISSLKKVKAKKVALKGTYVCSEGPRYETMAEIKMFRRIGGDVAGMTGVPEVVLANELRIPYANLSYVTNMCAGMQSELSHAEVVREAGKMLPQLKEIINQTAAQLISS